MKHILALILATFVLSYALIAGAHGNATHVMGTVTEVTDTQITVKTLKGKIVTLHFNADTIFQQNGITTNDARPHVGTRLIAEAATIEGKLVAVEIKFASPKAK